MAAAGVAVPAVPSRDGKFGVKCGVTPREGLKTANRDESDFAISRAG
jgi:hypothetical protein